MACYQLTRTQIIPADLEKVWDFISAPLNLKKITPDYLGFEITSSDLPDKMYQGMIVSYKVSPLLGLKLNWITEITHVVENRFFVDEQRIGPYRLWHHQHHLMPVKGGIEMTDIVTYKPPFGVLGALINRLVIRNKLSEIFEYRRIAIENQFNVTDTR
ncbi:MAG: SRPBCC family protein [Balneolaceae bacterium]|nr:SRPBCC family protein [Balneolaceae bacterium]